MLLSKLGVQLQSENSEISKPKLSLSLKPKVKIPIETEIKQWDGKLVLAKLVTEHKYPFEFLNPPQSEFYTNRFLDANFIVSAATSAGKTIIAELSRNGKLLYLSPLKAISQEKRDNWTSDNHAWSSLNVSISTGDYQLTPDRVDEMRRADIIVMTSEMLDSRSRNMASENNDWLKDIKTLVIDEFHLIGYSNRGDKLESALIRFTTQNPNCRLVCLSATMPNITELSEWLTILNGKQTLIINSNYRPVKLNRHYLTYFQSGDYRSNEESKLNLAYQVVREHPHDKFIVFVHTKNAGNSLLETFKSSGIKVEFHNADLSKDERIRIQSEFNSSLPGSLRVIIATSTLAWGVNTPADSVVVTGLHRGLTLIENQDIHQMCGRAGRIGKSAKGEGNAYVILPDKDTQTYIDWCEKISDIKSRMNINVTKGLETLCFHIISEVLNNNIVDSKSMLAWYEKTLARYQDVELTLENADLILQTLEDIKMIRKNELNQYYTTGLGKVSAYLYYSPFDIYAWFRNFNILFNNNNTSNVGLSWALGNADCYDMGYTPQPALNEAQYWGTMARQQELNVNFTAHVCATYYHLLNGTEQFPFALMPYKRQVQNDFDRIIAALGMIDKMYIRWGKEELWEQLKYQVKYGVPTYLLDLVKLPQIGAKRAMNLYDAGIKNQSDFKLKASVAKGVVGTTLYNKIISALN